ncbi:hypothetical protein HY524_00025 [Candidatus Berkelbacteria bacterium]|nr:hypothetical protein [Candidatus Berkelbacteria bacterium]
MRYEQLKLIGLNLLAVVIFMAGGALATIPKAYAGQTTYSETWTASKFRAVLAGGIGNVYTNLIIGPSEWTVSGTQGSTSWSETWAVSSWSETGALQCSDWICSFGVGFTEVSQWQTPKTVTQTSGSSPTNTETITTAPSGLYGWVTTSQFSSYSPSVGSGGGTSVESGASWPRVWTVTGTITTP